ncbi:MAG: MFS transporter [Actinobacteria bacterium]|nr:MFS transporter [Actinomycetota bacterium]
MPEATPGTWAPLALSTFRWLWIAQLVSNIGTWMQTVGAQWMLVSQPNAATLTAMAQAASLLPVLFVSLPAGVLADVFDRRRYLAGVFGAAVVVGGALAVLTAVGLVTPLVLLMLTFGLGVTSALAGPAWQAIQPELVPPRLIPAAAGLGSMNINIARAIGPAVAGVLLLAVSPAVLFAINAVSTVAVVGAVLAWRRPPEPERDAEPLVSALRSGSRYVLNAPGVRRVLLRVALFVVPGSALWALLAVVASQRLRLGPGGYGMLLGALGLGAVIGALGLSRVRDRVSRGVLLVGASLLYVLGQAGAALVGGPALLVVLLVLAGVGWLVVLSTFSTTLQLTLPAWVRARGMATYLIVLVGGQGVGAVAWGLIAEKVGIGHALLIATGLLLLGVLSQAWWPLLARTGRQDPRVDTIWPEPDVDDAIDLDPRTGPVVVEIRHVVTGDVPRFLDAAERVGVSRRRTGATSWALYQDAADAAVFVEVFVVPTWGEHLRQHHDRLTGYDRELDVRMRAFTDQPSVIRHLVPPGD